jgi:hypothetical protein
MVITLLEATIWFTSINIFKSNYTITNIMPIVFYNI